MPLSVIKTISIRQIQIKSGRNKTCLFLLLLERLRLYGGGPVGAGRYAAYMRLVAVVPGVVDAKEEGVPLRAGVPVRAGADEAEAKVVAREGDL